MNPDDDFMLQTASEVVDSIGRLDGFSGIHAEALRRLSGLIDDSKSLTQTAKMADDAAVLPVNSYYRWKELPPVDRMRQFAEGTRTAHQYRPCSSILIPAGQPHWRLANMAAAAHSTNPFSRLSPLSGESTKGGSLLARAAIPNRT